MSLLSSVGMKIPGYADLQFVEVSEGASFRSLSGPAPGPYFALSLMTFLTFFDILF